MGDALWGGAGSPPPVHSPDWVALIGTVVCIVLHIILDADKPFLSFIVGACVFWTGYIALRVWRDPQVLRAWGFRIDNLVAASKLPLLFFAIVALALAAFGAYEGTLRFPPHFVLLLLLYPLWGVVQQFLALGIVVGNLERLPALHGKRVLIALLTSGLFALVHLNEWRVAVATFGLEMVFVGLYFRDRNLLPLAVVHGWLGALYYLWVLDTDLWVQTFG